MRKLNILLCIVKLVLYENIRAKINFSKSHMKTRTKGMPLCTHLSNCPNFFTHIRTVLPITKAPIVTFFIYKVDNGCFLLYTVLVRTDTAVPLYIGVFKHSIASICAKESFLMLNRTAYNKQRFATRRKIMTRKQMSVRDLCFIGIFTAIIMTVGQLSIPMPYGVPMTLQTLIIPIAGIVLGAKKGTLATIVYILIGTVGLPVFSGFKGGLGVTFGPTGGFILSFPIIALLAGLGARNNKLTLAAGLVAGASVNYICGMLMYSFVMSCSLQVAYTACVLPFIPVTVVKMILSGVLGISIKNILIKNKLLV